MKALILAGGQGTRLRSVVSDLPKPLAPIHGRPFLEYVMDYWIEQGVTLFTLAVGYQSEKIIKHFKNSYRDVQIIYSNEEKPLGTGGALLRAAEKAIAHSPNAREDILILNGDTFFSVPLPGFIKAHKNSKADLTLSIRQVESNSRYGGIELSSQGQILKFGFSSEEPTWINGGVYCAKSELLKALIDARKTDETHVALSLEAEIIPNLLKEEHVLQGHASDGTFIDIGIPEDYHLAQSILKGTAHE